MFDECIIEPVSIYPVFTDISAGSSETKAVPRGIQKSDVLLDNYTVNLQQWTLYGRALKLMNGINGTKGVWKVPSVDMSSGAEILRRDITDFVLIP